MPVLILVSTSLKQAPSRRRVPEPIARQAGPGAATHTAQDRYRPCGGRDELSDPETKQSGPERCFGTIRSKSYVTGSFAVRMVVESSTNAEAYP